jgi:hypothetical protein
MPRPPVGTIPQPVSATALAAHVASRLVGRLSDRAARDAWLTSEVGVKLRSNGVERAAERARTAVVAWVLVDETRLPLQLEKAYVHFPGTGRRRLGLIAALRRLGVVRQILLTRSRRDLACVLVYPREDRDDLFAAVERLGEPFLWDEILEEDREVERSMWVGLAQRYAKTEGLIQEPDE